jgi:hypothetical protein
MIRWHDWPYELRRLAPAADPSTSASAGGKGRVVIRMEVIFGNLLLLLAELIAILLVVSVLLLQANLILGLWKRLSRSWRLRDLDSRPSGKSPVGKPYVAGVPEEKEG